MSLPIEDYGIIGDLHTAALVGRRLDRLAVPAPLRLGGLLRQAAGHEDHGLWKMARRGIRATSRHRHYREDTLVLETEFVTERGRSGWSTACPSGRTHPEVVRVVEGVEGK